MTAIAQLTLNGLSGADHVFKPIGIDPKGVATFLAAGTSPVGDEKLTVSVRRSPNGGKNVTEIRLNLPKVQDVVVGGVTKPTVIRTGVATITFSTDQTAPFADRDELLALVRSALSFEDAPGNVSAILDMYPYY
jgi:hypothetical protein